MSRRPTSRIVGGEWRVARCRRLLVLALAMTALFGVAAAHAAPCATAPTGLVAWYPMNELSGATLISDIHTSVNPLPPPHPGTPVSGPVAPVGPGNGPAPVVGQVGPGALYFYGPSHLVSVPTHPNLGFGTGDFSIDAWVRIVDVFETTPGFIQPIVDKFDPAGPTGFAFYIEGSVGPPAGKGGRLVLRVNGSTFQSAVVLTAPWANPVGNSGPWHHVAVTVKRSTNVVTFYLDGAPLVPFTAPAIVGSITNTLAMWLGETRVAGPRGELAIDELQIFNRELGANEVLNIYGAGAAGKCRNTLSASVGTNQPSFGLGQTLVLSAGLSNPGGLPDEADIYVGVLMPNGAIVFFPDGSFRPYASGVPLASPFSVTVPSFFSYQFTGAELSGNYVFFLLVMRAGVVPQDTVVDVLAFVSVPFSYTYP